MHSDKLSQTEIERRRPVWHALSDLFLDTDISLFYPSIRIALSQSGYDQAKLWHILWHEVAPVFAWNLYSATGVWDGWSEQDVAAKVLSRLNRPLRVFNSLGVHLLHRKYVRAEWEALGPWVTPANDPASE